MSRVIYRKRPTGKKTSNVPVTTLWKNTRMVRHHSVRAAAIEILAMSKARDLIKVNVIGDPGTGKTEFSVTLAHIIHKASKDVPYAVKIFGKAELANLREVMINLPPTNYIIIFDDVSFLDATTSSKAIKKAEEAITEIRHLPGHQDVKIIMILDFHYTMAVPRYMRQSNITAYSTIGDSDVDHALKLVGHKNAAQVREFIRISNELLIPPNNFTVKLGNGTFAYEYKKPFVPFLFFNKRSARLVVSPLRTWIDPVCTICASAREKTKVEINSIKDFDEKIKKQFPESLILRAIRILLYINGISTMDKKTARVLRFIEKYGQKNELSLLDLAEYYKLKPEKVCPKFDPTLFDSNDIVNKDAKPEPEPTGFKPPKLI